jgi:hypothetical protein
MDRAGSGVRVVFVEARVGLTGTETGMPRYVMIFTAATRL